MADVFISYSSVNKDAANAICHVLEENGVRCWIAPRDILQGFDYGDVIEKAIRSCKLFVLVYSKTAAVSPWVKGEVNIAFTEGKTILPYRIDETLLDGGLRVMLNQYHWIDSYPDYKRCFKDLLTSVEANLGQTEKQIIPPKPQPVQDNEPTQRETEVDTVCEDKQMINGHEYVDLGLSVKWATSNVGANAPHEYGYYFAWGETYTKEKYDENNSDTYGIDMDDISGDLDYETATANCGGTWRLPTQDELEELIKKCTWKWIRKNGVKGYKVTGSNGNSIFLPVAGYRYGESCHDVGELGYYWSSTPIKSNTGSAYSLYFGSGGYSVSWFYRYGGHTVRPVSE